MDSMTDERLHTLWLDERKLCYWRGDLTQTEIDEFSKLPNWSWYPSPEGMSLIALKVVRLSITAGRPRKISPTETPDEKKLRLKENRVAVLLKKNTKRALVIASMESP